jgi:hypothetical protein
LGALFTGTSNYKKGALLLKKRYYLNLELTYSYLNYPARVKEFKILDLEDL